MQKITRDELQNIVDKQGFNVKVHNKDISGMYLYGLNSLDSIQFIDCNLEGCILDGLYGWKFKNCNLKGTRIDPEAKVPTPSKETLREYGFSTDRNGVKVFGYRTYKSAYIDKGSIVYTMGEHVAPCFSVDESRSCDAGLYIAIINYLWDNYSDYDIVPCFCLRTEMLQCGDKFRAKRLFVTGEPFTLNYSTYLSLTDR